ncbi:MAG: glycoside hydrolase [Actinobacteria bacterium]|nr:glycoside hydrolase [Actinomycetota bacterium]MCA1721194.1 glycoside hydrolase [Actinomycetota bacterium]
MRKLVPALAVTLVALGALAVAPATASTPADSGTVTPSSTSGVVTKTWTGQVAGANADSDCQASLDESLNDHHTFKLAVPAGFYTGNRHVTMSITNISPTADLILTVLKNGKSIGSADGPSAGGVEAITATDPTSATFDAITCAFAGAGSYTGTLTLKTVIGTATGVGGTSTTAAPSTYGNYDLRKVTGVDDSGEPSIGVDWKTGNVYYQSYTTTVKAEFPSTGTGAPALSDVSCLQTSATSLDPILATDSRTGRTGVSQLLVNPLGFNSASAFFEGDPEGPQTLCDPSQGGGVIAGPDHQTLGGGVYPKPLPAGVAPLGAADAAFYYCSQTLLAGAICSRSDDGGATFVNGLPPYTTQCGGLHGHVRVGPDGYVYLPNKNCQGAQGVAVSADAGQTWTVNQVTGSTAGATDPSVYADRAGNVYFGYVAGDGRPAISVSKDHGKTWSAPVYVGEAFSIKNAVFSEVVAGDDGRAAFAFLGTATGGDRNVATFGKSADGTTYTGGRFDMYVATTVDGGRTYNTINATPNDPVQRGMICTNGTTCSAGRNLLDFNDITVDKVGRVLIGYADGCINACVTGTSVAENKQNALGVIARQTSGPLLFAASTRAATPTRINPATPTAPDAPAAPAPSAGGNLAATGLGALTPTGALALLLVAGYAVRRRRTA